MVDTELVEGFRKHVGRETFRQFIFVLNRHLICVSDFILLDKNRLLYWQQLRWDGFVNEHPEFQSITFADLRNAFCRCHIHDRPLLPDIVPVVKYFRAHEVGEKRYQKPFHFQTSSIGTIQASVVTRMRSSIARIAATDYWTGIGTNPFHSTFLEEYLISRDCFSLTRSDKTMM